MSEPRPDNDLTASGTTPPAGDDDGAGTPESATEIVAADMAAIDATPPADAAATPAVTPAPDYAPPPMAAYTPPPSPPPTDWATQATPPTPPATDWAAPAATSPTPPSGTPVQAMPEAQAWAQAPAPAYQPPPTYPPQPQPGWPQQPPAYQQPQAYAPPPAYPPQQPYQQPPGYLPQQAWQQPGQPAPQPGWVQPQGEYWAQPGGPGVYQYKSSVLAVLAGIWLLLAGLFGTLGGVGILAIGRFTSQLRDAGANQATIDTFNSVIGVFGGVLLVCGILMLLSAIGIWIHKSWARVLGILFSLLGLLISLPFLAVGNTTSTLSDGRLATTNFAPFGIGLVALWGLSLLFLIISGGHFHKQRVG